MLIDDPAGRISAREIDFVCTFEFDRSIHVKSAGVLEKNVV